MYAGAARIENGDDRRPGLHGEFLYFDDFFGVHLSQRAAERAEILRGHEDELAVHVSAARDDAVPGGTPHIHPEIRCARFDEKVDFRKTIGVEQKLNPLPGGQLPLLVLAFFRRLAADRLRPGGQRFKFINRVLSIRIGRQCASPKVYIAYNQLWAVKSRVSEFAGLDFREKNRRGGEVSPD